ncbi:hypothetical protein PCURB6_10770 [Paenibacillus curdlanolyticus]|nr:hypothetical protein PCURB6_10770 [Paenibacillus curdlanolyticus]
MFKLGARRPVKIRDTLIRHYYMIFFFIACATVASACLLAYLIVSLFGGPLEADRYEMSLNIVERQKLNASDFATVAEASIHAAAIQRLGGWLEVLNDDGDVVQVIGNKRTLPMTYSKEQLLRVLSGEDPQYYVTMSAITDESNQPLDLLVMLPYESITIRTIPTAASNENISVLVKCLIISIVFFFLALGVLISIYGRWTANRIAKPFNLITESIQQMTMGRHDTRLDFEAEYELGKIRDAFNYMVEALQDAERHKQHLELSKTRMMADISHDLKTPMTTIQGYAYALREGHVKGEERKQLYLTTICEKSQRVVALIDELFEYSRLEHQDYPLSKKKEEIGEFVRQLVAEHYGEIEERAFELELQLPDAEIWAAFDAKQLGRAITNLLQNALKYNPPGTRLRIALFDLENELLLEVGDNGAGIPAELRATVFEPFVRGDNARGSDGGTGLGLSIARRIVEKHGGHLGLTSRPDEATTFYVIFPKA